MPGALAWVYQWLIIATPPLIPSSMDQGKGNYGQDQDHNIGGTLLRNSWACLTVKVHWLTDISRDNLQGLSRRSDWNSFGRGCNLSRRCLFLLINYRRSLWVVTVVLEIVQRSSYIHMGKFLFVSSTPSLLQIVAINLTRVLAVGKGHLNLHAFTLFPTLCHVVGLWLIWLLNVKWL